MVPIGESIFFQPKLTRNQSSFQSLKEGTIESISNHGSSYTVNKNTYSSYELRMDSGQPNEGEEYRVSDAESTATSNYAKTN